MIFRFKSKWVVVIPGSSSPGSSNGLKLIVLYVNGKWQSVKYGASQGSILGPLLFLIYINDLQLRCTNSKSLLFADDTNLTFIDVGSEDVQKELNEVKDWLAANKLSLNVNKTVQMNVKQNAIDNNFLIDNSTINCLCRP